MFCVIGKFHSQAILGTPGDTAPMGAAMRQITRDAIYLASASVGPFDATPAQLSKLTSDGNVLWSQELTSTMWFHGNSGRSASCAPALSITAKGSPIVACAVTGKIHIYEFDDAATGRRFTL
jgi:hypothetical protein